MVWYRSQYQSFVYEEAIIKITWDSPELINKDSLQHSTSNRNFTIWCVNSQILLLLIKQAEWSEVLEDLQVLLRHRRVFLPVVFRVNVEVGGVALVGNFRNYGRLWRQGQVRVEVSFPLPCPFMSIFLNIYVILRMLAIAEQTVLTSLKRLQENCIFQPELYFLVGLLESKISQNISLKIIPVWRSVRRTV